MYHVNLLTGNSVRCKELSGCPEIHSLDPQTAHNTFYDYLVTLWGSVPAEFVFRYCEHMGYEPLVIVPSGSDLYNTSMPDTPRHDYDFVVFVHDDWDKYRHAKFGPVDMFLVPVSLIPQYLSQSQVAEALFGYHHGYATYVNPLSTHVDELLEDSAKIFAVEYCEKLAEHVDKHARRVYPVKRLDREYKHCRRWVRYLSRGTMGIPDPRLTTAERELWLRDIAGKPIFEEEQS